MAKCEEWSPSFTLPDSGQNKLQSMSNGRFWIEDLRTSQNGRAGIFQDEVALR